jgi:multiple sugar transport system ATP-binding protein
VIAGIRPESFRSDGGTATLSGVVDVVEPTGPDTMVIVNVEGQLMTARLGARERPAVGEASTISVDTSGINLFDPATESRI